MRVLVWQWGRRGAGPRFAMSLAEELRQILGTEALLSLSSGAEILQVPVPVCCDLLVDTYAGRIGLAWRFAQAPLIVYRLTQRLAMLRIDVAVCAMPGPLDLLLRAALRRIGVPVVVVVHDADAHPGDVTPLLMMLQRQLMRRADAVVALSTHVAVRLSEQCGVAAGRLFVMPHPPLIFGPMPPPPLAHGSAARLLFFGRLLAYKGLDLLASAVRQLGARRDWELRVVGSGPESVELGALRGLPGVTVENRWVPEDEIGALFAWADIVVLPYKEASQSGVAPAAIAAGRYVVSTRVGGLVEQLGSEALATLCEPNSAGLAAALRALLDAPPGRRDVPAVDRRLAWRSMAELLLGRITSMLGSTDRDVIARREATKP